jgi:hypothetical protein
MEKRDEGETAIPIGRAVTPYRVRMGFPNPR